MHIWGLSYHSNEIESSSGIAGQGLGLHRLGLYPNMQLGTSGTRPAHWRWAHGNTRSSQAAGALLVRRGQSRHANHRRQPFQIERDRSIGECWSAGSAGCGINPLSQLQLAGRRLEDLALPRSVWITVFLSAVLFGVPLSDQTRGIAFIALAAIAGLWIGSGSLSVVLGSSFVWAATDIGPINVVSIVLALLFVLVIVKARKSDDRRGQFPQRRSAGVLLAVSLIFLVLVAARGVSTSQELFLEFEPILLLMSIVAWRTYVSPRGDPWRHLHALAWGAAIGVAYVGQTLSRAIGSTGVDLARDLTTGAGKSNYLSVFALFVAMIWITLVMGRRGRVIPAVIVCGISVYIVFTLGTRSVLVGFAVFFLVLLLQYLPGHMSTSRRRIVVILAFTATIAALYASSNSLLAERISNGVSSSGRSQIFRLSIESLLDNPVVGTGVSVLRSVWRSQGIESNYTHNFIIDAFARYGVVLGLILVAAYIPRILHRSSIGMLAPLMGMLATAFVEPSIETARIGLLFVFVLVLDDCLSPRHLVRAGDG